MDKGSVNGSSPQVGDIWKRHEPWMHDVDGYAYYLLLEEAGPYYFTMLCLHNGLVLKIYFNDRDDVWEMVA